MQEASEGPTLAIACGGTGGHFYPGLSIAETFRDQGGSVVLFIGGHHIEEQLAIAAERGLPAVPSPAVRLPGTPLQMLSFPFRFLHCLWKNWRELGRQKVDLALAMGSFASVPLGLAAVCRRIPLALHEGNASLGQANRFLSRSARLLALSFPLRTPCTCHARQEVVGMPIRQQIIDAAADADSQGVQQKIRRELGLEEKTATILVFGGSQGAHAINKAVLAMLPALKDAGMNAQFIHLTGHTDNQDLETAFKLAGITAVVKARDPDIERLFLAANTVICRAGASTILELAIVGRAPILIPFPGAKENHQLANAKTVMDLQGGWLLTEEEIRPERLIQLIQESLADTSEHAANLRKLAYPEASRDVVNLLFELLQPGDP